MMDPCFQNPFLMIFNYCVVDRNRKRSWMSSNELARFDDDREPTTFLCRLISPRTKVRSVHARL